MCKWPDLGPGGQHPLQTAVDFEVLGVGRSSPEPLADVDQGLLPQAGGVTLQGVLALEEP